MIGTKSLALHSSWTSSLRLAFRSFSSEGLDGKVAIVTASSQGIGKAIAKRLCGDGAKVMISSRKEENVKSAVDELRADLKVAGDRIDGVVCHVGKPEHRENLVAETVKRFGGVDVFVSNAGTNPAFGPLLQCTEDQWDKIFDTNVKATFLLSKLIVPLMQKRGGGSIVIIASIGGLHPLPFILPYSVSKTALIGLTKALSHDCAPDNIRVNAISPGIIKTSFSSALTENETMASKMLESLHIKRFGEPEDISGMASFLCSKDASYITGENIVIAGGGASRL